MWFYFAASLFVHSTTIPKHVWNVTAVCFASCIIEMLNAFSSTMSDRVWIFGIQQQQQQRQQQHALKAPNTHHSTAKHSIFESVPGYSNNPQKHRIIQSILYPWTVFIRNAHQTQIYRPCTPLKRWTELTEHEHFKTNRINITVKSGEKKDFVFHTKNNNNNTQKMT